MKPSQAFNLSARVLLSLTLLLVCPLLLSAQSNKKTTPPPPPPQNTVPPKPAAAPPPQQQQRQQPPQQTNRQQTNQQRTNQQQQQQTNRQQTNQQRTNQQQQQQTNRQQTNQQRTNQQQQQPTNRQQANPQHTNQQQQQPTNRQQANPQHTNQQQEARVTKGPPPHVNLRLVPPNLQPVRDANGRSTYKDRATGRQWETNTKGEVTRFSEPGREVKFGGAGKPTFIRDEKRGIIIDHGQHGERHIITEHRDANRRVESRVESTGSNRGFVERRFERGGHEYIRRTSVYEGRTSVTVYRTYYYGGVAYYHYVPAYYYAPVYYGWAYNPWPAPVYYTWGWYGDPWYGPYGYYFAPYPVYPSAAFWLTDYLIAENLQAAYEAQAAANADAAAANADAAAANADAAAAQRGSQAGAVTLTPEVKQMIAEEVKAQLAAEQAAAAQNGTASGTPTSAPAQPAGSAEQVPPALDPNLRVFIVTTSLDVTASGQACSLSPGDVLKRMDNSPDSNNTVGVMVLSSKKSDCSTDSSPRVQVADLQDMHNRFREQLDNGLKTLADNQGKKGIPSGPVAGGRKNPDGTAVPDLTATKVLQDQKQEADQTEKEVQQAGSSTGSGGNN